MAQVRLWVVRGSRLEPSQKNREQEDERHAPGDLTNKCTAQRRSTITGQQTAHEDTGVEYTDDEEQTGDDPPPVRTDQGAAELHDSELITNGERSLRVASGRAGMR